MLVIGQEQPKQLILNRFHTCYIVEYHDELSDTHVENIRMDLNDLHRSPHESNRPKSLANICRCQNGIPLPREERCIIGLFGVTILNDAGDAEEYCQDAGSPGVFDEHRLS